MLLLPEQIMRLDVYLAENKLVASRTEAKSFITEGAVKVDGSIITKPSFNVSEDSHIDIDKTIKKYVSRGGIKLEAAISEFCISVDGRLCLDIGASSGGFTDCLLQHGASRVISVDSGYGQIAESLADNPKVTVIENYNARFMSPSDFEYQPTLAVMDVSFISATYIIPALSECIADGGSFVCLIKPQFEVGRERIGKGGIVKDDKTRRLAVEKVKAAAERCGFKFSGLIQSPITGGDGNIEFLAHFIKGE